MAKRNLPKNRKTTLTDLKQFIRAKGKKQSMSYRNSAYRDYQEYKRRGGKYSYNEIMGGK